MSIHKINYFLLTKKSGIVVPFETNENPTIELQYISALLTEMKELGFHPTKELLSSLARLNESDFFVLFKELTDVLKKTVGADVQHKTLFPNFPHDVNALSNEDLYFQQVLHYWGSFFTRVTDDEEYVQLLSPQGEETQKEPSFEDFKLRPIGLLTKEDVGTVVNNLLEANVSISESDKELISLVFAWDNSLLAPSKVPFKENLIFFTNLCLTNDNTESLYAILKTPTDILRFAVALSDGDYTLVTPIRFRRFTTKEKNLLISLLNNTKGGTDDIHKHKKLFRSLFKMIGFGSKKAERYPQAKYLSLVAFDRIDYKTFNGTFEELLQTDLTKAIRHLSSRPGEFMRKLNRLISTYQSEHDTNLILDVFANVVDDMPTAGLLSLKQYLSNRNNDVRRYYFPRGHNGRVRFVDDFNNKVDEKVIKTLISTIETSLVNRFSTLPSLGNIVLDEALKQFKLPLSLRTASDGLLPLVRGSAIPLDDKKVLRFFCYWEGQDIDLSAGYYGENGERMGHVSFQNLRDRNGNGELISYHSGDVTWAPEGATEFIDINLDAYREKGARFVAMNLNVFSGPTFASHDACFAGWMELDEVNSGQAFNPAAVRNRATISSNTKTVVPVVFDIVDNVAYWLDISLEFDFTFANRITQFSNNILDVINLFKGDNNIPTVFELLELHAKARGTLIEEGATTTVTNDEGVEEIVPIVPDTVWNYDSNIQFNIDKLVGELIV